ncbi:MAG TPA: hypothetical protein VFF03_14865 [Rhodocyclaceae bacterium]|nr:hypothetical protein [Rhodocyclaceae bacterium]
MEELLALLHTPDGLMLGLIIFSSGIGIGASVVQINSILRRKASDAVTSIITWALLLAFSLAATYYLWHSSENLILPATIGTLALSSAVGLAVSIGARKRLAEVEAARRQPQDQDLLQTFAVKYTALSLRRRLQAAREQRTTAA